MSPPIERGNRNIFSWVKEIMTIDAKSNSEDKAVNKALEDGFQILNNRTEKLMRFQVVDIDGKKTLQSFEVMITRYVMGK